MSTATGASVNHRLTQLDILDDCNVGFDLDGCNGQSCVNGGLAPGEGASGVDNALAGLAPVLANVGGNLAGVIQAFSDALCGMGGDSCQDEFVILDLAFDIDVNGQENCARVRVLGGGFELASATLNASDPDAAGNTCVSGTLGIMPIRIGCEAGQLNNAVVRMTISEGGFSNGVMGATASGPTAVAIGEAILEGAGAVIAQVFDIDDDLVGNTENVCNSLSGTYRIGGVAE